MVSTFRYTMLPLQTLGCWLRSSSCCNQPSPPEKKGFFRRTPTSTTTSSHRSMLSDNEPFSISRESFESYRRSFVGNSYPHASTWKLTHHTQDISARSPVLPEQAPSRQSLDSRIHRLPRSAVNGAGRFERPQPTDEEGFEEVGLNDEAKPKKRGLFSSFRDSGDLVSDDNSRPSSSHRGFHLPGRKRGQSGQGAELGQIDRPNTRGADDGVIR